MEPPSRTSRLQKGDDFIDAPGVIGDPGFHRGGDAERRVDPGEVAAHEVERRRRRLANRLVSSVLPRLLQAAHEVERVQEAAGAVGVGLPILGGGEEGIEENSRFIEHLDLM